MATDITPQERAEIDRLLAENAALKAKLATKSVAKLTLRVSEKGGVSVYGLGKWPVTLYQTQWDRLLANSETIRAFIAENQAALATKD